MLCFLDFDATFVGRSESELSPEKCARTSISVSSRLSVNPSNNSGRSRKWSSESPLPFLFLFWCRVIGSVSRQIPGAGSSRRSEAGPDEDKSCNVDVENELLP